MGSKLNSKKKNNIGIHVEHSTRFDTEPVIQKNNEYRFMKGCSANLHPPIILKRLKKYDRKLPKTTEELIFGLNQNYPKQRKIEEKLIKNNLIRPINVEYQSIISIQDFYTFNFKPESFKPRSFKTKPYITKPYKTKRYRTPSKFSKLNPEIVLDFIKLPSVNKLMKLFDLMYTESIYYHAYSNDLISSEKNKYMSIELKKYLYELCYQKFCELWLNKTDNISILSTKQLKRFIHTLLKRTKCRTPLHNINLKKLILRNGGLTGYPKKPHLVLCINIICRFFYSLLRKKSRLDSKKLKKKMNWNKYNNVCKQSIKLYHKGTTKRKSFLDIVDEYKHKTKRKRLNFYQVADIKSAYEDILKPGEYINKEDLEKCANENYKKYTELNHNISSEDLTLINNDDFDYNDIDTTPESIKKILYVTPTPKLENVPVPSLKGTFKVVTAVQAIVYQDMDISASNLKGKSAANYSRAETSKNLELEMATNTSVKETNSSYSYSKSSEKCKNELLLHSLNLTNSEKRMLTTILYSDMNLFKYKWNRYPPSKRAKLYKLILYFGSFKMAFCDKLKPDHLDLKFENLCDIIDLKKLLKSVQVESCVLKECFTFTEVENFLILPLGKMIVNNISQRTPNINILFSFVENIITLFCEKVKDFCRKSGLKIILNKESLFESLSNVQIGKDILNTELSLKYANIHTHPSLVDNDECLNDVPGTSNSEHFCNTGFCIKKNSSNEEICKSMVNIPKSDDSIHQSWKECNNSRRFIYKLLKACVTLPIKESNTGHGSKFVEVYVRWFCEEYLQDDKIYKLAVSAFKKSFYYIDTASELTGIRVQDAVNNALMILYDQPCFAKGYESDLNIKCRKCLSSSKYDSTNYTENHSDNKCVNIIPIEELQNETNVNVQTDPIDTNNVGMSLVPSKMPTSNGIDDLNNVITKSLFTPDPQSTIYDENSDLIEQFLLENSNSKSHLYENVSDIDDANIIIFDTPIDDVFMDIDGPNYSRIPDFNEFNEDCPFGDEIPTPDISFDHNLPDAMIDCNLEFQQAKEDIPLISDQFVDYVVGDEESNLQFQQAKNMEEVSMISSDQLVNFDQNDEINPSEIIVDDQYGFYNAGVLLPP